MLVLPYCCDEQAREHCVQRGPATSPTITFCPSNSPPRCSASNGSEKSTSFFFPIFVSRSGLPETVARSSLQQIFPHRRLQGLGTVFCFRFLFLRACLMALFIWESWTTREAGRLSWWADHNPLKTLGTEKPEVLLRWMTYRCTEYALYADWTNCWGSLHHCRYYTLTAAERYVDKFGILSYHIKPA